ncbi:MAG: YicC family protein [Bacteroidetes bacterium GWF2_38_335]|nr:MAG: YicC family protein [Bacteroidetes bacterium GWF2_38_335]HBS88006.1 YicC family protein [Bacteroidales bacterium]
MLKSMTGYGKAICELADKKITVEIKSLNSKQLDLNTRIPSYYREKDLIVRNEIARVLVRGKVDFAIYVELTDVDKNNLINKQLVKKYYLQIKEMADEMGVETSPEFFTSVLRFPEVLKTDREELDENEWNQIYAKITSSINELNGFREQEGIALQKDISLRIKNISSFLGQIDQFEKERVERIKTRLKTNLEEFFKSENIDANRFEQEVIYYLEKIDITEEKVRLANHCKYFNEIMKAEEYPGKKLGFISQEIGREINTIGSKANDSDIQKLVVGMKDDLEKIKEQLLNVL